MSNFSPSTISQINEKLDGVIKGLYGPFCLSKELKHPGCSNYNSGVYIITDNILKVVYIGMINRESTLTERLKEHHTSTKKTNHWSKLWFYTINTQNKEDILLFEKYLIKRLHPNQNKHHII